MIELTDEEYNVEWKKLKEWTIAGLQKMDEKYEKNIKPGQRDRFVSDEEKEERRVFRREVIRRLDEFDAKYGKRPREW